MKGDFTRVSFDPTKHYAGVRMQQGRVQLDADWNEQIDTQARLQQLVTTDLVGLTGAPITGGGFQVTVSTDGTQILLSPGRMYVGGVLCELNAATSYDHQTDYPGAAYPTFANPGTYPGASTPGKDTGGDYVFLAYLDVWSRHVTALEDPNLAEIALGGPDTGTRVQTLAQVKLAALSADGVPGTTPPVQVPPTDWSQITAPSPALLAAAAFLPDSPGSLSLGAAGPGFVQLPSLSGVDFSTGFALEAWVYLHAPTVVANTPILYLSDGAANTIEVASGGSDGTILQLTVGAASCTATGALDLERWTHIAVSIAPPPSGSSNATVTFYKNGSLLAVTGTVGVPPSANRTLCFLGSNSATSTTSLNAMLAEVRLWATGLTAPTVSSRITGHEAHLVAYYKLNQTGATTQAVIDSSSAGRTAAVNGKFAWSTNAPALAAAGTSTAQYTGPENQLYRVEVHSVSASVVTYKWSRDNGSIAANATMNAQVGTSQTLTLLTPVRDDVLGWASGQWVEITTTPSTDLSGYSGLLAPITSVQGNTLTFGAVAQQAPGSTVTVRRWDGTGTFPLTSSTPQSPWLPLENGIAVQFSGPLPFKDGDYWLMPARTATSAIQWPLAPNMQPAVLPPLGIRHQYAQLAKVYLTPAGKWKLGTLTELRPTFPPIQSALQGNGILTVGTTSVGVGGALNVGTSASPEPLSVFGFTSAQGGLTVTGGSLSVGQPGAAQTLNASGIINANAGMTVSGATLAANAGLSVSGGALTVGAPAAPQPLNAYGLVTANTGLTVTAGAFTLPGTAIALSKPLIDVRAFSSPMFDSSTAAISVSGTDVVTTSTSSASTWSYVIPIPHGATLTDVKLWVAPSTTTLHTAVPVVPPTITLLSRDVTQATPPTSIATAKDPSTTVAAYGAAHSIELPNLTVVADRTKNIYYVAVTPESGTGALSGTRYSGIQVTWQRSAMGDD